MGYINELLRLDPQYMTRDPNAEDPTCKHHHAIILSQVNTYVFRYHECHLDCQCLYSDIRYPSQTTGICVSAFQLLQDQVP